MEIRKFILLQAPSEVYLWRGLLTIFFRLFKSCAQAYISLCVPSSQILPASRQARQICHVFSKNILPFVGWLQAARFPYSDALHIFPQNIHRYFMFFCMQDALPTRPKQACISVDKYNMQDFFWNVLFFLRKFFNFFCELFHRKFSILFIAYTFECYIEI